MMCTVLTVVFQSAMQERDRSIVGTNCHNALITGFRAPSFCKLKKFLEALTVDYSVFSHWFPFIHKFILLQLMSVPYHPQTWTWWKFVMSYR